MSKTTQYKLILYSVFEITTVSTYKVRIKQTIAVMIRNTVQFYKRIEK